MGGDIQIMTKYVQKDVIGEPLNRNLMRKRSYSNESARRLSDGGTWNTYQSHQVFHVLH